MLSVWLRLLPSSGYVPFAEDPVLWFKLILMPAIALSFDPAADLARQLRTGLVHVLEQNYIVGARARGLVSGAHPLGARPAQRRRPGRRDPRHEDPDAARRRRGHRDDLHHAGIRMLAADSALRGDVPVVQGTLVVAVVLVLAFSLIVNIVLEALQPATRRGARAS